MNDEGMMKMDGYDDCIIGIAERCNMPNVIVYDYEKVISKNIDRGMNREEAEDWYGFNQLHAWVGETTPIFVRLCKPEEIEHLT
ncbi:hypothetical protein EBZ80_07000 [bacterium]|nr:hypothetical protein [bacterium]